jgi:hypothetical protein
MTGQLGLQAGGGDGGDVGGQQFAERSAKLKEAVHRRVNTWNFIFFLLLDFFYAAYFSLSFPKETAASNKPRSRKAISK